MLACYCNRYVVIYTRLKKPFPAFNMQEYSHPIQYDLNHELPRKRWLKVLWKRNYFWKQIGKIWHILFLLSWPILLEPCNAGYILLLSSICSSCGASWKCLFNLFPLKGSSVCASSSTTSNALLFTAAIKSSCINK